MQLDGRRILVTGSARGIGLAVVNACLEAGATVLATDADEQALRKVEENLGGSSDMLRFAALDVGDAASVDNAMAEIADWSALDGLVNNAAMLDIDDAGVVTDERFAEVLNVNLTGALRVTRAALPKLRQSTSPAIVNTLSTQSFFGVSRSAAYASAKGGLHMLTRSMAVDFGTMGLRVNAVAPGFIDTRMALTEAGDHEHELSDFKSHYIDAGRIPLRRPGTPADCAGAFIFLMSDRAQYITGQTICVDGGLTATY